MAKKPQLVARLFIDPNNHRNFTTTMCYIGVSFSYIEPEGNDTNVSFVTSSDLPATRHGLTDLMIRGFGSKDALATDGLADFNNCVEWRMDSREPKLSEADAFCKAAKALQRKMSKHESSAMSSSFKGQVALAIECAKADVIWFEHLSEKKGKARFTQYQPTDIDSLLEEAVSLLQDLV